MIRVRFAARVSGFLWRIQFYLPKDREQDLPLFLFFKAGLSTLEEVSSLPPFINTLRQSRLFHSYSYYKSPYPEPSWAHSSRSSLPANAPLPLPNMMPRLRERASFVMFSLHADNFLKYSWLLDSVGVQGTNLLCSQKSKYNFWLPKT